ncbi:MAG: diguanylate cyclase, partial [Pseudomonadota bacterium]
MEHKELVYYLENVGKDPSRLIFEDELTGLYNRRFLFNYFNSKITWDALENHPLSLIMMDVDHFKTINDTHGHDAGDQVLVWVAGLLREAAGDDNLPIRYAGDEFMILMPKAEKQEALRLGERLIQLIHDKPALLEEMDSEIALTLSIGVATAPSDAQDEKVLIQKADTALYYAKKTGRDRLANVGEIAPQNVFVKTVLHQLGQTKIAGRKEQLSRMAEALKRFGKRQSQFLVVEGAAGMGKSMFLDTIQRTLSRSKSILQIKVTGVPQELYRPYYLIGNIIIALLNLREDKGEGVLNEFTPEEKACLSPILPQLGKAEGVEQRDQKIYREGIFASLIKLFQGVIESRHTVLLIDDLHFSDEATLLLLRRLILRQGVPLFVCGAATDTGQASDRGPSDILRRFCAAYGPECGLQKLTLPPLTGADIVSHLEDIFPRVDLPESFGIELEGLTQGNPLFLSEMVRKLIMDGKISLAGHQWVVQPLEEGYLPRSLEEVVRQKISALDEESKELLNQISVFGDKVPVSALTGSAEKGEAQILEFVDNAVSQGLISSDFQVNDETIRFLSTRVLDITYGSIGEDLRQELHERVGNYQESLYERDLLPSAATLAYHFKRSTNQEKARSYEQIQTVRDHEVFSAEEAVQYTGESPLDARAKKLPLDPESLEHVPGILRGILLAVRNVKLYPPGSKSIIVANEQIKESIDKILDKSEFLTFFQIENALSVNGENIDVAEFKAAADGFIKFLGQLELKGLGFRRDLTIEELGVLMEAFGQIKRETIQKEFWQGFLSEKQLHHVELTQVQYTVQTEREGAGDGVGAKEGAASGEQDISSRLEAVEGRLDSEQAALLPEFTRSLLNAAKSIRLYPLKSRAIESAINQLMEALGRVLAVQYALTMGRVGDSLLVNGEKLDFAEFQLVAQSFLKFLDSLSLKSITFLGKITIEEMKAFIDALGHLPTSGVDSSFWARLSKEKKLEGILFDRRLYYEAKVFSGASDSGGFEARALQQEGKKATEEPDFIPEESAEIPSKEMPEEISDLLLKGDKKEISLFIQDLFRGYKRKAPKDRRKVIVRCVNLMTGLNIGLQNQLARILAGPLLSILSQEEEPSVLKVLADLLHRVATILLQFIDYPLATRTLLHLQGRHKAFLEAKSEQADVFGEIMVRPLEPETQQLLLEDFRSDDPLRRQNAAQLLGSLGNAAWPLLVDVIKNEEDLRVRQIAAALLGEQGPEPAKLLRRELGLQTTMGERLRILAVIDRVTQDLTAELTYAFSDESAKVREEAFRLAERLNNERVENLLLDFTGNEKIAVAVGAIKCLGRLKREGAQAMLLSLLKSAKKQERLIACCQSLGQIGDPASIEPLANILKPGMLDKFYFWRRKYGADLRASAAFALSQIDHPRVGEILAACVDDKDPRIRELARTMTPSDEGPPKKKP